MREQRRPSRRAWVRAAGASEHGSGQESAASPSGERFHETAGSSPPEPRGLARILVVEDEPSMRLICRVNLEFAGFEVEEAENGAQGLERARDAGIDLVLLDVMLPDIGGHQVAERLAAQRGPAFAFLSARAGRDDLRIGYLLGAVDYLVKPFDPIELGERVGAIVRRIRTGESERYRLERLDELQA